MSIPELFNFIQENNVKLIEEDSDTLEIISTFLDQSHDDNAFFIVQLNKIIQQYKKWNDLLPRIKPFYAIKCNPNPAIIQLLKHYDVGFDCASQAEIRMVLEQDVSPDNIIFANPCKASGQIKYARAEDIDMVTFDDIHELLKIKLYHPDAKLVIRIKTDDSKSECKFSCKFGVGMDDVEDILRSAKSMYLDVMGVSFHVGSNSNDPETFYKSIKDARTVFDIAEKIGFKFTLLDIGGGFPGHHREGAAATFEDMAKDINKALDEFFPEEDESVKIIAEPGRYFVASSHTLVTNIIGKKESMKNGVKTLSYTLNDGVYGSFNCIYFDHAHPTIMPYNERDGKLYETKIFGPTCDSIDTICESCKLPDLAIGEWVYIENFGAYTSAAASTFNGFQTTKCVYCLC